MRLAWLSPVNAFLPVGHLVDHRAERREIRTGIGVFPFKLLGRHVLQRPENHALRR